MYETDFCHETHRCQINRMLYVTINRTLGGTCILGSILGRNMGFKKDQIKNSKGGKHHETETILESKKNLGWNSLMISL